MKKIPQSENQVPQRDEKTVKGEIDYVMKVVVADNFAPMRRVVCRDLREMGFKNVQEAENGQAALEIIQREPVGLLITEWHMPNMGGLELMRLVRGNHATAELPIIMVTIEDLQDYATTAVKAGVNGYLVKPVTPEGLWKKIKKVFPKSRSRPPEALKEAARP